MVITPWHSFVSKEMNFFMASLQHILETEGLVPALLLRCKNYEIRARAPLPPSVCDIFISIALERCSWCHSSKA